MALGGVVYFCHLRWGLCGIGVHRAPHLKLRPVVAFGNTTFTAPLQTEISTRKSVNFGIKSSSPACLGYLYTRALYLCALHCDSLCAWCHIYCYHHVVCLAWHKLLVDIGEPSLFRLLACYFKHLVLFRNYQALKRKSFNRLFTPTPSRRHRLFFHLCGILSRPLVASSHPSNETYSLNKEELGNTCPSPRASVISLPELFTYAIYIVIAFVLDVIYIAITLLLYCLA